MWSGTGAGTTGLPALRGARDGPSSCSGIPVRTGDLRQQDPGAEHRVVHLRWAQPAADVCGIGLRAVCNAEPLDVAARPMDEWSLPPGMVRTRHPAIHLGICDPLGSLSFLRRL